MKNQEVSIIPLVKLTPKQDAFCKAIVEGNNATKAYLQAYDTDNVNSAQVQGHKLLKRDDIQERIEQLRKDKDFQFSNGMVQAREQQIQFISERIKHCKSIGDESSIIRYTDMLNKIHGLYKDSNTELTTENKLQEVDTDVLLKLVT